MGVSELQKEILHRVCLSKQKDTTQHLIEKEIGRSIGVDLKDMIQAKLVYLSAPREHGKRLIRLTDKGQGIVFNNIADVDFDTLLKNHPYLEDSEARKEFNRIFKTNEARTQIMRLFYQRLLGKNLFDGNGKSTVFSMAYKWERRDILIEITRKALELRMEDKGSVNIDAWKKWLKKIDGNIKIDALINPASVM